jgi:hypothetical protein
MVIVADKRIPVTKKVWMLLHKMRDPGETYDTLLRDMIAVYLENVKNSVHGAIPDNKEEERYLKRLDKLLDRVAYLEASGEFISLEQAEKELGLHDEL